MYRERKCALGLLLGLWLMCNVVVSAKDECDKSKCLGPVRYYEDLKCKPIYESEGDCCAIEYDCSHLNSRSPNKCYANNGKEYAIGERLREEDIINPCDIGCFCAELNSVAKFTCAIVDCFPKEAKQNCYLRQKMNSCCGAEEVCPENPNDRLKCQVGGKTYLDGERFYPEGETNVLCECMEGYTGENVPPYCRKTTCGTAQRHPLEIRENCAPVFEIGQSPTSSCNSRFRCQNANDTIVRPIKVVRGYCKYGNLKLEVGSELNQSTDSALECVKCVCEVPPVLTCQRLKDDECKVRYPQET